jgi:hypothetical protein
VRVHAVRTHWHTHPRDETLRDRSAVCAPRCPLMCTRCPTPPPAVPPRGMRRGRGGCCGVTTNVGGRGARCPRRRLRLRAGPARRSPSRLAVAGVHFLRTVYGSLNEARRQPGGYDIMSVLTGVGSEGPRRCQQNAAEDGTRADIFVRQVGSLGTGEPIELLLRAIFTRWPTTTIEQRWCFCWGGSGVRSRSRRQSAGARPEGYCTELFEELVEGDSFRELHVQ